MGQLQPVFKVVATLTVLRLLLERSGHGGVMWVVGLSDVFERLCYAME